MNHIEKVKLITCTCILVVAVLSGGILLRHFRPSRGVPYEIVSPEQAREYMEYESDYLCVDVSSAEDYAAGHMEGFINIPYEHLVEKAITELPDAAQVIYVVAGDQETVEKACRKLCELGYKSITLISEEATE